ncbi:hypothetical protein [Ottowia sp. VDI28]|uniref:hypothetical protein n=1 Tax=Ottowia sp. VDI28 TaxID=3133968 RepID=UPI003C2B40A5
MNRTSLSWSTVSRSLAGALGGYALAQILPVALVAAWNLPRADAVLAAMLLSFPVYVGAFMAAFAARDARRAWGVLGLCVLGSAGVAWIFL